MRSTITTLVLTAAMTSLAGAAAAEPQTIRLPVSQAETQTAQGVADLYGRIEDAAEELCRIENRAAQTTYRSCVREVIANAVDRAEIAPLADYAAALEGGHADSFELASR